MRGALDQQPREARGRAADRKYFPLATHSFANEPVQAGDGVGKH